MAQTVLAAAIPGGGPVLELGAGTGPVTKALIDAGCPPDQIIVVEQDRDLCRTLERRLTGVRVLQGNALAMGDIRQRAQIRSVSVVLSGLPMRIIAPVAAARCYTAAFALMPPGGSIIQYTYGFRSPVDAEEMPELQATFVGRELRNVPPMGIWSYRLTRGLVNGHARSGEWTRRTAPGAAPAP
ncbi:MAG: class I SAM-dependent methyltransferase [Reyranella sp.]|uniref:class I SAM-dependent methyltransferase n=1 Tax=Reyranella sp. TaxID=1929291 RepID=UPI003D0B5202